VLVGEADRAVKLDAGFGDDQSLFRGLGFHGSGHRGIDAIGVAIGRDLEHQRSRGLDPYIDVCRLMLQRLKAADQASKLFAHAQVVQRDLLRFFHHTEQFGGQHHQRKVVERIHRIARGSVRGDEIGRRIRKREGRKLAALHRLRRRQRTARRVARHIVQRRSVAPAGADEKAVSPVGTDEQLLAGQTKGPVRP
jgi:hypothetical protein